MRSLLRTFGRSIRRRPITWIGGAASLSFLWLFSSAGPVSAGPKITGNGTYCIVGDADVTETTTVAIEVIDATTMSGLLSPGMLTIEVGDLGDDIADGFVDEIDLAAPGLTAARTAGTCPSNAPEFTVFYTPGFDLQVESGGVLTTIGSDPVAFNPTISLPEPSAALLLLSGVLGVGVLDRGRRRRARD